MPAPAKPKKTQYNRPIEFREAMNSAIPRVDFSPNLAAASIEVISAPIRPTVEATERANAPRSYAQASRYGLAAVWVAAALAAGAGLGFWVTEQTTDPAGLTPPTPLTQAFVAVRPSDPLLAITPATVNAGTSLLPMGRSNSLTVITGVGLGQRAANSQPQPLGVGMYQLTSAALQPGFGPVGSTQGNIGTTPVIEN